MPKFVWDETTIGQYFQTTIPVVKGMWGVEIEMEGRRIDRDVDTPHGWRSTDDGSLRGDSREYVLRGTVEDIATAEQRIRSLYYAIQVAGVALHNSPRCGVHIHYNAQHLTHEDLFKVLILYYTVEEMLMRVLLPAHRQGNLFCLRLSDAPFTLKQLLRDLEKGRLVYATNDGNRYGALNLNALTKFGSLEFRALNTPTTPERIIIWMKCIERIITEALTYPSRAAILESVSASPPQFFRNLFESVLEDMHLNGMCDDAAISASIVRSARRVQSLAYREPGEDNFHWGEYQHAVDWNEAPDPDWDRDEFEDWCRDRDVDPEDYYLWLEEHQLEEAEEDRY